ncbi:MAG: hypothetical protein PVG90_11760 [Bacillota bacterium]
MKRHMKKLIVNGLTFILLLVLLGGCGSHKNSGSSSNSTYNYSGSASKGDVLTIRMNHSANSYSVNNETTGFATSGNFSYSSNSNLSGIKTVSVGSKEYFTMELNNKVLAANFPVTSDDSVYPTITFTVSAALDNTDNENIAGDYTYVEINGNDSAWGFLNLTSPSAGYKLTAYEYDDTEPQDCTDFGQQSEDCGTWTIDSDHKERLVVNDTSENMTYTGFAYATVDTAVFLLDRGEGNGFVLGVKNPDNPYTSADIGGTYKFIHLSYDETGPVRGAGSFVVNSDGSGGTYYHKLEDGSVEEGTLGTFTRCQSINNMFYFQTDDGETGYIAVSGDVIFQFFFDENGDFCSYGVGIKS